MSDSRGYIVPIGGAEEKLKDRVILRRFAKMCGGRVAEIAVIPTASRLPETGRDYVRLFRDLKVRSVKLLDIRRRRDCESEEYLRIIERADGVFMTGGDQMRLATTVGGTPVAEAIKRRNREGLHVAGTSAGAAFISTHMIAFGEDGPTPRFGMVTLSPGDEALGQCEALRDLRRLAPRTGTEMNVSARKGQAIRLANGLTTDDLDPEAQIGRHASNHGELLEILRSEHGDMGSGRKKELRDDRGHTAKMTRPIRPTQGLRQTIDIDPRNGPFRIEFLGRRRPDDVDLGGAAGGQIGLHDPRITLEIARIIELGRVDEDRNDDPIRMLARFSNERKMSRM